MPLRRNLENLGGLLTLVLLGKQLEVLRAQLEASAHSRNNATAESENEPAAQRALLEEMAALRQVNEAVLREIERQNAVIAATLAALGGDPAPLDDLKQRAALEAVARQKQIQTKARQQGNSRSQRDDGIQNQGYVELNVAEAARALGVTAARLRENIKTGNAPGQRIGGRYFAHLPRSTLLQSAIHLSQQGAAQVEGVTVYEIQRRIAAGTYPNAWQDAQQQWLIPVRDLVATW